MKKLLFTGFEKFLDHPYNPSEMLAHRLDGREIGGFSVVGEVIPLRYGEIRQKIRELIELHHPDAVILSGLAGRTVISIEKVAINYANSRAPYNCGSKPSNEVLVDDGPAAYFSTLPIPELLEHLRGRNIPVKESLSAGAYGCNQIFYEAMHYLHERGLSIPAGFIHVPPIPEQAVMNNSASVPIELQLRAMEAIIDYLGTTL